MAEYFEGIEWLLLSVASLVVLIYMMRSRPTHHQREDKSLSGVAVNSEKVYCGICGSELLPVASDNSLLSGIICSNRQCKQQEIYFEITRVPRKGIES